MMAVWIIGTILAFLVLIEIGCRLYYEHRFGIPFHSRVMGEYPYNSFVEQTDVPLYYRFKKNFHSSRVAINRFRCRGKEPAVDGRKKRIMVIGESMYFGAKLYREETLWSHRLEKILQDSGYGDWEVINAGNPMYNSVQHRILWEQELREAKPDILILNMGGNDITQAWMMGSQWKPGIPWPWKFILALERKSPWWAKLLSRTCFYFLLRRNLTARKPFIFQDDAFAWEACLQTIQENFSAITKNAREAGAKVGYITFAVACDLIPKPGDRRKLDAIQANWEPFSKGNILYTYKLLDFFRNKVCPQLDTPFIDLQKAFNIHPRRYELFLDIAHWNARGMRVVAETLFRELVRLGWLDAGGKEDG